MATIIAYLDSKLAFPQLLRLVPIFIALHNLEEIPRMERWSEKHAAELSMITPVTTPQFTVAVTILTAASFVATYFGLRSRKNDRGIYVLLCIQFVFFANAWQHLSTSLFSRAYSPGVATAVIVNLPFSVYLLRRALQEDYIVARRFLYAAALSLVLAVPTVLLLRKIGEVTTSAR